jgi:hypothetical protein
VASTSITRSDNNVLYQFHVSASGQPLLDGRATVVLNAEPLAAGGPS